MFFVVVHFHTQRDMIFSNINRSPPPSLPPSLSPSLSLSSTPTTTKQQQNREVFTVSVMVIGGSTLQAHVDVSGPVSHADVASTFELVDNAHKFVVGHRFGEHISSEFHANFEHLNVVDDDNLVFDIDDDDAIGEDEDDEKKRQESIDAQRRRARQRREHHEAVQQTIKNKVREEGRPLQKTFKAKAGGWYQFCVEAHVSEITVELDFRKESDYGIGLHGHVYTLEEKAVMDEKKLLEEDTAALEGLKDEDFISTREKLNTLRRLLGDIQAKQSQERHRLMVHSATNEHSHSRMVLSSLLETIFFMLVTGFQVFTIRRWFQGAPSLGR